MYKHLICLVVLKSCEAEQSTKEERAWKQSETLTNGHLGPLSYTPSFTESKKIQKLNKLTSKSKYYGCI